MSDQITLNYVLCIYFASPGASHLLKNNDLKFKITDEQLHKICGTEDISDYISHQQLKLIARMIRRDNDTVIKGITFESTKATRRGPTCKTLPSSAVKIMNLDVISLCKMAFNRDVQSITFKELFVNYYVFISLLASANLVVGLCASFYLPVPR